MKRTLLALSMALLWGSAATAQDLVADGEKVFKKCAACHAVGEGAKNKVGPHLNDLFGRTAGTVEKFKYSDVMIALGEAGMVWDEETVSGYLANPKNWLVEFTPSLGLDCADLKKCRGKMAFAGLKKEDDIAAVIAFMLTHDADGMPEADAASDSGS